MARSTKASTRCARRSTDQATLELLGPPCASCRSPAIPWVRASISRIPMGGNLASQGTSGRAELLEEPRTLRGDRLVPLLLGDRASLEFGAGFLGPLLPRQHLAEEQVRVPDVRAFLGVPAKRLARIVQPALFRIDGPELPPSQTVLRRHRHGPADLADALLRLARLVQRPSEVRLRHGARLVQRVARGLVEQGNGGGELAAGNVERAQVGHRL